MNISQAIEFSQGGNKLPLSECFETLQGEGAHTGRAVVFVRLQGCDVACSWCDTKYSWIVEPKQFLSVEQIVDKVKAFCTKCVVITGGEPTLYNLEPLLDALHELGYEINIETSGTGYVSPKIDWVTLSPKSFKEPLKESFMCANELKVVVGSSEDFERAHRWMECVSAECRCYIQAQWGNEESLKMAVEFVLRNPRWRLSLQTHKYIGIE